MEFRALANLSEEQAARQRLSDLCAIMADGLDETDPLVMTKLAVLSGFGRAAPDIFSEHAGYVVNFVSQARTLHLLYLQTLNCK